MMKQSNETPAFHRLAGQTIWVDPGMPELGPFRLEGKVFPPQQRPTSLPTLAEQAPAIQATGWLADQFSTVSLWQDEHGTWMEIPAAGRFWTAADGSAIAQASRIPASTPAFIEEALLGPPLVLALALRDTWCLHASAALFKDSLVAFLGESGQGKSTLAAYLKTCPGWRLVADDILPVAMNSDGMSAWPRFPQLKLSVEAQPGPGLPEEISFGKVCILSNTDLDETPAHHRLPAGQSVPAFLAHTAGTRLFDPDLLGKHLAFCAQAAGKVPVYSLGYPRRLDALPMIRQLLESIC
jgi:hypothetical protein